MSEKTDTQDVQNSEQDKSVAPSEDSECGYFADDCGCYVDPCCCCA